MVTGIVPCTSCTLYRALCTTHQDSEPFADTLPTSAERQGLKYMARTPRAAKVSCVICVHTSEEPHWILTESQLYSTVIKEGIKKIIEH